MTLKEKWEFRRFERYWRKEGRKDLFTWVHRYLRLHKELLEDSIYQSLYDYVRDTLIAYFKRDFGKRHMSDKEYGKAIDALADIFNKRWPQRVNKYQHIVESLYELDKENPTLKKRVKI